jgi:hypothetical protein
MFLRLQIIFYLHVGHDLKVCDQQPISKIAALPLLFFLSNHKIKSTWGKSVYNSTFPFIHTTNKNTGIKLAYDSDLMC